MATTGPAGADWGRMVALIDAVASDLGLVDEAVRDVQSAVAELGRVDRTDIARHTRALMAAAVRAIADRRGPTEAELAFVEELAVARARQDVPIQDVLTAIHVAERHVWSRTRELAPARGVGGTALLDARDLYDDWAEQVRSRLIVAHRRTELGRARSRRDTEGQLVRRILQGGSAAMLAAAEAGLSPGDRIWVVRARAADTEDPAALEAMLRTGGADVFARVDDAVTGILPRSPSARDDLDLPIGVAGPVALDDADIAAAWSLSALETASSLGRTGLQEVADVAVVAALRERPDLARAVVDRHLGELREEGAFGEDVARTVVAFVEQDRLVDATARALHVHPNTVRHRLRRFEELTALDVTRSFDAVAAWWGLRSWLAERG